MKIKKYIAASMKEAVEQMRRELGDEAVILSTRSLPKANGHPGEMLEITAAADTSDNDAARETVTATAPSTFQARRYSDTYVREISRKERLPRTPVKSRPQATTDDKDNDSGQDLLLKQASAFASLQDELADIRERLVDITRGIRYKHSATLNDHSSVLYQRLLDSGLREDLTLEVIGSAMAEVKSGELNELLTAVRKSLGGRIKIHNGLEYGGGNGVQQRRVIVVVGAPGGGKTSALAKMAIAARHVHKADVRIISADTHRIGGVEQLQTIAAIAGLPFELVYSSQELRQAVVGATEPDFIFVDTAGCGPHDRNRQLEIRTFLEAAAADEVLLVQDACASEYSIRAGFETGEFFNANAMILSKVDECSAIGPVFNALLSNARAAAGRPAMPLAYFCTGPAIPDDIEPASRMPLVDMLLPLHAEPARNGARAAGVAS